MKTKLFFALMLAAALSALAVATRTVGNGAFSSNKATLSTVPVKVWAVLGQTTNSANQYIHVYDHIAWMTNGGTPMFSFPIGANNYFYLDFSFYGADMNALGVCNSSTAVTTTLGSTNCSFQAIITGNN